MAMYGGGSLTNAFNSAARSMAAPQPDKNAQERFFRAIRENDANLVQRTIDLFPEATGWRDAEGLTGLMVAARDGADGPAAVLIKEGADVNAQNANQSTPLMFAAHAGKAVVAVQLLDAGADPNHANLRGHTPVMSAAAQGNKNTLKVLLEKGGDPRGKSTEGMTALQYAQDNKNAEIAGMLVRAAQIADQKNPLPAPVAPAPAPKPPGISMKTEPLNEYLTRQVPANADDAAAALKAKREAEAGALKDLEKRMKNAGLF